MLLEAEKAVDDLQLLAQFAALQIRYVDALDSKRMPAWADAFSTEDSACYVLTTRENVNGGLPLALMLDDCRGRILDRITYITKIWAGTFQDYATRHFVQRTAVTTHGDDYAMRSNFTVVYTPEDSGTSGVLAAGVYEDILRMGNDGPRLLSRKAILDTSVLPRYLVYPL
jgi:3-phenylpropionate/cinnamic acid dioxygenase small subunit